MNKSRNVNNNDNDGQKVTMTDNKTVLQALALINDCNKYKMDLTTNGVVITPTLSSIDDKYNVNHYYQRQADFEQEGHEEISSED